MNMINFKYKREISSPVRAVLYSNFDIDNSSLAVILNSRQTKTPSGSDAWIVKSIKAVKNAVDNNYILITSYGMNTWELICWAGGNYNGCQIIICPVASENNIDLIINSMLDDFKLNQDKTGWLFFKAVSHSKSPKSSWPIRDKLALSLADVIMPVSIRPNGNLLNLINQYSRDDNKTIMEDFRIPYSKRKRTPNIMPIDVCDNLKSMSWNYITHWTRASNGPWLSETKKEFYQRLVNSNEEYPNTAFNTLKNILHKKKIYASSTHHRKGVSASAFTSLHPKAVLSLMHWRRRDVRWNFEPYSIAIARKTAIKAGIQPVIYGKPALYDRLTDKDKPYFQSEGVDGGNWRDEDEWRYIGDFNLAEIEPDDMIIIVKKPEEIELLRGITESKVISFT